MTTSFVVAACLLAIAAAAPLLLTLLGRSPVSASEREAQRARNALAAARAADVISQQEYEAKLAAMPADTSKPAAPIAAGLAIAIAVLLPLGALALYAKFGAPLALDPANHIKMTAPAADAADAPDLATAISGLEAKLQANPDDAQGWALLARGYQSAQRFDEALTAMSKVRALLPEDLDVQVSYAEALALASPTRTIDGEAAELIADALRRDPDQQRGLWLSGIAAMQRGDSAAALNHWRRLEGLLPEGSDIRNSLAAQIRSAESNGNGEGASEAGQTDSSEPAAPDAAPATGSAGSSAASITVTVQLDPSLQDKVLPSDTLFVFARAAEGPRMPLAIQRLTASQLPATVRLDDSMSMMPAMTLSKFPEIVIGARISRSGNASASPGDLQTLSAAMRQSDIKDHVQLSIDEIVSE